MKKLVAHVLIWLLLISVLSACQLEPTPAPLPPVPPTATATSLPPSPTPIPTQTPIPPLNSPTGPPLRSMHMFTKTDGWGLIPDALLITHDGGSTWYSVPTPGGNIDPQTAALFIDVNQAYMVLAAPDGQSGQVYYTVNGGGSWQVSAVPFLRGQLSYNHSAVYFLETSGATSGPTPIALYSSVDRGQTWNKVFPGANPQANAMIPETGIKTGISFINATRGWLGFAQRSAEILIYHSENGGSDWSSTILPAPQNLASLTASAMPPIIFPGNETDALLPVDFVSTPGGDRNMVFYITSDGGISWSPAGSVVNGGTYTFVDPLTGWVWAKRGLYFTNDGARNWQILPVAFGRSEYAIHINFLDAKTGWLLTADSKNRVRVYSTSDGGNTWMALNP